MTNSTNARIHIDLERSWFTRKRKLSLTADFLLSEDETLRAISKTRFAYALFQDQKSFIHRYANASNQQLYLVDVRGRSLDSFRNDGEVAAAKSLPEKFEELLFFRLLLPIQGSEPEQPEALVEQEVTYRVLTHFEDFQGSHIRFKKDSQSSPCFGEVFSNLSPYLLSRFVPGSIHELRLGLEFYRVAFFGIQWGSAPSVYRRFYLNIRESSVKIFVEDLIAANQPLEPFQEEGLLHNLGKALSKAGIAEGFESMFQSHIVQFSRQ